MSEKIMREALDALKASLDAMEHMGDALNSIDAVSEEDEKHHQAFDMARRSIIDLSSELGESLPGDLTEEHYERACREVDPDFDRLHEQDRSATLRRARKWDRALKKERASLPEARLSKKLQALRDQAQRPPLNTAAIRNGWLRIRDISEDSYSLFEAGVRYAESFRGIE